MAKKKTSNFLDLNTAYNKARFVVVPVPYEATTTYGKGTMNGPGAILKASGHVEWYDHELDSEPCRAGIHTQKPIETTLREHYGKILRSVKKILDDGKIPVLLGGEHSIAVPAVSACKEKYKNLSVLQFDAHADLKDEYEGSKFNHGCVMRRVLEICPAVQVGVRSMDIEERDFARNTGQWGKIHFAEKLELAEKVVSQLSDEVYISFDVDVLDPSIMPSTGTPEPGGLDYYEVLDIVRLVAQKKKVVGFDVTELSPIKGLIYPDFVAAKLTYKFIGYIAS
ncbi:agmatinase [Candidatus Margulisiibacteriota bacterium]